MEKKYLFGVAILSLILVSTIASAYSYSYPTTYVYSYPTPTSFFSSTPATESIESPSYSSSFQKNPSFINLPSVTERSINQNSQSENYFRIYQGPIYEKTSSYDEFIKLRRRGRFVSDIDSKVTEKYIGESIIEGYGSDAKNLATQIYQYTPQNPSYYDGGSSESYNTTPGKYFTQSGGYYCWRYDRSHC